MTDAAGAAGDQRLQQWDHIRLKEKAADPLGPQKSFMPRKCQRVNMHGLHINGKNARRLGRIQNETQTMRMTKRSHCLYRHQRSADITGMKHHHGTGVLPQQSVHGGSLQRAVCPTGDPVKRNALFCQLGQRPHDCVMLHGRDQHMVARLQKTFQQHVQTLGNITGKDHVAAVRAVKQFRQLQAGVQYSFLSLIRFVIAAAIDVAAAVFHIMIYGLCHALCLGKAGAGIVKIDALHESTTSFVGYPIIYLLENQIFLVDISIIAIGHFVDLSGIL